MKMFKTRSRNETRRSFGDLTDLDVKLENLAAHRRGPHSQSKRDLSACASFAGDKNMELCDQ